MHRPEYGYWAAVGPNFELGAWTVAGGRFASASNTAAAAPVETHATVDGAIKSVRTAVEAMIRAGVEPPAEPGETSVTDGKPATLSFGEDLNLDKITQSLYSEALKRCKGNRTHAAKLLGVSIRTLQRSVKDQETRQAAFNRAVIVPMPEAAEAG